MESFYVTNRSLTLAGARQVRDRALAEASKKNLAVALVIVDRTGALLIVEANETAQPGAVEAAIAKAKGAARYRLPTHKTSEFVKNLPAAMAQQVLTLPDLCAFQGGMPIQIDGETVGAIGISGGTGDQDITIANAASS